MACIKYSSELSMGGNWKDEFKDPKACPMPTKEELRLNCMEQLLTSSSVVKHSAVVEQSSIVNATPKRDSTELSVELLHLF